MANFNVYKFVPANDQFGSFHKGYITVGASSLTEAYQIANKEANIAITIDNIIGSTSYPGLINSTL